MYKSDIAKNDEKSIKKWKKWNIDPRSVILIQNQQHANTRFSRKKEEYRKRQLKTLILARWFSFKLDIATDAVSTDFSRKKGNKKDGKKGPSLKHLVSLSQMDMGSKTISAKSTKWLL